MDKGTLVVVRILFVAGIAAIVAGVFQSMQMRTVVRHEVSRCGCVIALASAIPGLSTWQAARYYVGAVSKGQHRDQEIMVCRRKSDEKEVIVHLISGQGVLRAL